MWGFCHMLGWQLLVTFPSMLIKAFAFGETRTKLLLKHPGKMQPHCCAVTVLGCKKTQPTSVLWFTHIVAHESHSFHSPDILGTGAQYGNPWVKSSGLYYAAGKIHAISYDPPELRKPTRLLRLRCTSTQSGDGVSLMFGLQTLQCTCLVAHDSWVEQGWSKVSAHASGDVARDLNHPVTAAFSWP